MAKTKAYDPEELKNIPLAELHSHVGAAVHAAMLWTLAHEQGIKLPTKDFWKFRELVTVTKNHKSFSDIDKAKYHWTELIQSSPLAMEPAVHETIGGAYRSHNITQHEIRFNPMKRNRSGERDLDYIILATIRGMERAQLEYPVKAGAIMMLDRVFNYKQNEIIYRKAVKYQSRGIIGIDIAGPQVRSFRMDNYIKLFRDAKKRGFGVTIHTGEEGSIKELELVIDEIEPHRIGHGVMAARSKKIMSKLVKKNITLEICPTSNLRVGVFKSVIEQKKAYRALFDAGVKITINTDGPDMYGTSLWNEICFLVNNKVFTVSEMKQIIQNGFDASFIRDDE